MNPARQSTALELSIGPVLDADGVAVTDCVVGDFKIKKTTSNYAALNASATLTHVSAGTYDLVLTTSDTDTVGMATIAIDDTVNACAPVRLQVIEEAVYDALYAASAAGAPSAATIADAVWDEATAGHVGAGTFGPTVSDSASTVVNNLDTPVSTRSSHSAADVWAVATRVLTAGTNINGSTFTAIPWNAAWDAEVQSEVEDGIVARNLSYLLPIMGTASSGTTSSLVSADLTQADADYWKGAKLQMATGNAAHQAAIVTGFVPGTDTLAWAPPFTAAVANTDVFFLIPGFSVWDDTIAEHAITGSTGEALAAAGSAGDPWTTALPGAYGAGTAGKIIGDNINATISSRLAPTTAGRTLDVTAGGAAGIDWGNVENPSTAVALDNTSIDVVETANNVGNGVTVTTNNDKTGYTLSTAGIDALWEYATSSITTAGGIGKLLVDNVNATIGSRASQTSVDDLPTNAELATALGTADDATLAAIAALSIPTAIQIADALLVRNVSNTEGTAPEHSLTTVILAILESSRTSTTWTIRRTGGTTHATKTLTLDAAADPVTGVT